MDHVRVVLALLRNNTLYAKASKCYFGVNQVEYLSHFISGEGVSTYPRKIEAVVNWPTPSSIKENKGVFRVGKLLQTFCEGFWNYYSGFNKLAKRQW